MAPTILIAGATGNTGQGVVETLSKLWESNKYLSGHRLLALTRSLDSEASKRLASLPGIDVAEKNWVEITEDWLREHEVVKIFIAPHLGPSHFVEESGFLVAALGADVKYVVRISTNAPNVRPSAQPYYARAHWAIEALLSSPDFQKLQWTSLQPNAFASLYLVPAVEFVKQYRKTGKQELLRLIASEDAPVGIIDPYDVGVIAAHLLSLEDAEKHNNAKYVINGPEDITGRQVVEMIEQHIGTKVENVSWKDMSIVDEIAAANQASRHMTLSIKHSMEPAWEGECTTATTSKEILELAAPTRTPTDVFEALLKD